MMHWAAQYIGIPWELGATGPDSFDCWGLVRHVQRTHYGRELPALAVHAHTPENIAKMRLLMRHSPWRKTSGAARDGDVLLMQGSGGPHIGVALEIGGFVGCLHAIGSKEHPMSTIYTTRIEDLAMSGFTKIQIWQHTP
jgi:cell wall-associated NlpC family hydrolase